MTYEHKENTGSIFKNIYAKDEKHPAYKGQINVKGELLDIAMWVKDGAKGKFFSVAISEPYVKPEGDIKVKTPDEKDDLDKDLPF